MKAYWHPRIKHTAEPRLHVKASHRHGGGWMWTVHAPLPDARPEEVDVRQILDQGTEPSWRKAHARGQRALANQLHGWIARRPLSPEELMIWIQMDALRQSQVSTSYVNALLRRMYPKGGSK
jgi:hypothetical protein